MNSLNLINSSGITRELPITENEAFNTSTTKKITKIARAVLNYTLGEIHAAELKRKTVLVVESYNRGGIGAVFTTLRQIQNHTEEVVGQVVSG